MPSLSRGRQREDHDAAGDRDHGGVDQRAHAHHLDEGLLALEPRLDVEVGVVGDQAPGAAELAHHSVAGVDAEPALDAAEIGAVPDVDAGRADMDALQALDAIAGRLALGAQLLGLFRRAARLAAVVAVGDVERVFVGQRGLDARPRTHIGQERRIAGRQILHQRRPRRAKYSTQAPPVHHATIQPGEMLTGLAGELARRPPLRVAAHMLRGGRLRRSARW